MNKICTKCQQPKELLDFYDGYTSCKQCHCKQVRNNQKDKAHYYSAYRVEYAKLNKDKSTEWIENWLKDFEQKNGISYQHYNYNQRKQKMLLDPSLKKDLAEKQKAYRQANRQELIKKQREYYKRNRQTLIAKSMDRYFKKRNENNTTTKGTDQADQRPESL